MSQSYNPQSNHTSRKKIYIAYTGGTIGMKPTANGFAPVPGFFTQELAKLSEVTDGDMPAYVVHEYSTLIDSANISPQHWTQIAEDIRDHYNDYDGFVVIHGTDTMAYTASALSFMLENLAKPVILTGSQIPLRQLHSDARDNLVGALFLAAHHPIPEVCLYFHNKLYRGNRTKKVDSNGFSAFDSPNFLPLFELGADVMKLQKTWSTEVLKQSNLNIQTITHSDVATLSVFPGIQARFVEHFLHQPLKGLVLQTYGMGNAPIHNSELMMAFHSASQRGIIIVNCSQCLKGRVNMRGYEAGKILEDCGVISGHDMTVEAALTKLTYLLNKESTSKDEELNHCVKEIKELMQASLRGELTRN
ncbi:MAG: asparaginase [Pseudomonadota bacterium]